MAASELPIDIDATALAMAQAIFGDGTTITGASYSGDRRSSGVFSDGDATSSGVVPGDTGVILSTGRARDFTNSSGAENQNPNTSSNMRNGVDNDPLFNAAAGTRTYDASFLDVDFIPDASVMTMQFVFSSEEYPEFQNSVYQDFVGVWINGTQVPLSVGDGNADPGNINDTTNENLFIDNTGSSFNTEMDGFTVTMTLTMNVTPNTVNSIRIGIADVSDSQYDSNLLIAADSVQTTIIAMEDTTNLFPTGTKNLDVLGNDINNGVGTLAITHINGIPAVVGTTVTLTTGQTVTLKADGTFDIVGDGDIEDFNFTYTIDDGSTDDIGIVNVSSIPCFVAGTLIRTPNGEAPVDNLKPGDMVITRDDGACPVRWVGTRTVQAVGEFAPIHISAGTFGDHRDLLVSPQHRIMLRDSLAELLFGEEEVLVAAKDLLNDHSVTKKTGGTVQYVHVMFDKHQIVYSEGLASESFLPGPQTTELFEQPALEEICDLFPELDPATGQGYSAAARRTLRRYEAQLLLNNAQAA